MATSQLSIYFFIQAAVIVTVCQLVGRLAQRIGQPQVVGEMIAGVALGPSIFGLLLPELHAMLFPKATMGTLYVAAQLGVGLYMFLVGTEFCGDHFRARARSALSVSLAGILVPFVLAFALAPWLVTVPNTLPRRCRCWRPRSSSAPRSRSPRSRCSPGSSTSAALPARRWAPLR